MVGMALFPKVRIQPLLAARDVAETGSGRILKPLVLPSWLRRIVWMLVVFVCFFNAVLAFVFACVYVGGLVIQDGFMVERAGLLSREFIPFVIGAYLFIAAYFFRLFGRALIVSVRLRRLGFYMPKATNAETPPPTASRWRPPESVRLFQQQLAAIFMVVSHTTPEMFELIFLSREIMEVATQSYQAYKCSTLISQDWINTFYVSILAINCWISPLIHFGAQHDAVIRRFLFLWSDVVLDFASTLIIPVFIIISAIFVAFVDNLQSENIQAEYAFDVPYSDTFLVDLFKGVQQICIVNFWDFVGKMLPFMSMAGCLNMIMKMVDPQRSIESAKIQQVPVNPLVKAKSTLQQRFDSQTQLGKQVRRCFHSRLMRWLLSVHIIYLGFFAWGAAIVSFHVSADYASAAALPEVKVGCKSSSKPWLKDRFSCSVLEINCFRRHINGSADEIDAALRLLDPQSVSSLIVSHCPALVMPPRLTTLSNLMGLEVADSVIMSWGYEAALKGSSFPGLLLLTLTRVNMTELPQGLQHPNFPPHLADISISVSNITSLPADLHTKWRGVVTVYLERTLIDHVPSTLAKMPLYRLSLMGNRIQSLPEDLLSPASQIVVLSVAKNPIKSFPDSLTGPQSLNFLLMDYTDIESLPPWLLAEGATRAKAKSAALVISAGGSRYCVTSNGVPAPPGLSIVCRLKTEEEYEGYPLSFNMKLRAP